MSHDTTSFTSRAPKEACAEIELDYSGFNSQEEEEFYHHGKPPTKSFLGSVYEPKEARASPRPPPTEHGFLQHHNTRSFETTRTGHSSAETSFSTSGYAYRSSSSFQSRSRSSTLATECTPVAIRFTPTPIPQNNTFVDELVPSGLPPLGSKLRTQITTTEQQDKTQHQYPTPWGKKKKGSWWRRLKFWNRQKKEDLGWGERYDIWMISKNAVRGK
ncbi:hypothetical protein L211DRAFT_848956 [Terfezia boudieri ATCC MYA-4762]|uniref:Uncharacterized protein n=1 Tax=Terfezia boudieri ATCC MYA-4762 TaxID=1051890 RepID=A0A3N4LP82_9PEZI|nr:hypothetical protein L211DRAFT_848956 [Terfezia boudieri ATCC MYA-4762]